MAACPICRGDRLEAFSGRPAARCPSCGSLERHRALARELGELLTPPRRRARALEAGPLNRWVYGRYLSESGWRYSSVDRWRAGNPRDPRNVSFVDHEADLCDLARFRARSFDLFITQHVIEEIVDYERALSEVERVLRVAGTALLEIPYDPDLRLSERHDPDRFGNVWRFGVDMVTRVRDRFERVDVISLEEGEYRGRLLVCRKLA